MLATCAVVVSAIAVTACDPADPAQRDPRSSTSNDSGSLGDAPGGADAKLLAIGREYAACVRGHGVSGFPDMVVVSGQLTLPDTPEADAADAALRANTSARQGCAPILAKLPANAQKNRVPSADDRQRLLQYAQCMRDNGVPQWPDPAADGSFPIAGTPLGDEGKSARMRTATQACKKYWDQEIVVK